MWMLTLLTEDEQVKNVLKLERYWVNIHIGASGRAISDRLFKISHHSSNEIAIKLVQQLPFISAHNPSLRWCH